MNVSCSFSIRVRQCDPVDIVALTYVVTSVVTHQPHPRSSPALFLPRSASSLSEYPDRYRALTKGNMDVLRRAEPSATSQEALSDACKLVDVHVAEDRRYPNVASQLRVQSDGKRSRVAAHRLVQASFHVQV